MRVAAHGKALCNAPVPGLGELVPEDSQTRSFGLMVFTRCSEHC